MGGQIAVPQAKPNIGIKKPEPFKEREALCTQSPPSVIVGRAGQIVENRVNIGANGQTEQSDVISVTSSRNVEKLQIRNNKESIP